MCSHAKRMNISRIDDARIASGDKRRMIYTSRCSNPHFSQSHSRTILLLSFGKALYTSIYPSGSTESRTGSSWGYYSRSRYFGEFRDVFRNLTRNVQTLTDHNLDVFRYPFFSLLCPFGFRRLFPTFEADSKHIFVTLPNPYNTWNKQ